MYRIKTYDKLSQAGLSVFDRERYAIADDMQHPDSILVRSTPLHGESFGDELLAIVRVGAGFNTIPVEEMTKRGVAVFNCPGGNANAVKEMTIAAMIMMMRRGLAAMDWMRSLPDEEIDYGGQIEKGKSRFTGPEIMGKTIGIVGVGAIGGRMAMACDALGMKVLGYDPFLGHSRLQELRQYADFRSDLKEMLAECDVVTVHIPLNEENEGFIGAEEIAAMKDGAYLINYARGLVVDNDAVCEALDSGKLRGFATDFPTVRELKRPDVFATPHLASGSPEAEDNCSTMAARQTIDYLENGNITNSVNLPNVSFARAEGDRITVIHDNKVGMLGMMTDRVVRHGLNIENLVNKGRGPVAYTIMDFNGKVPAELADDLAAIDGVTRVRVIE
jgi:D-3-phosphoglycerate dehydrogenase